MLRNIISAMTVILMLVATTQAVGQEPEVPKKDADEANRLFKLADEKIAKGRTLVAPAMKQLNATNAMIEAGTTPPAVVLAMQQQFLRMMDEMLALLDEHDELALKACRLLKRPPDSFTKVAWSPEKKAAFEEANKEVRASMRKAKAKSKAKKKVK